MFQSVWTILNVCFNLFQCTKWTPACFSVSFPLSLSCNVTFPRPEVSAALKSFRTSSGENVPFRDGSMPHEGWSRKDRSAKVHQTLCMLVFMRLKSIHGILKQLSHLKLVTSKNPASANKYEQSKCTSFETFEKDRKRLYFADAMRNPAELGEVSTTFVDMLL